MMLLQKIIKEFDKPARPAGGSNSYKMVIKDSHILAFNNI